MHLKSQFFYDRGTLPVIRIRNLNKNIMKHTENISWFHLLWKMILSIDKSSNKYACIINGKRVTIYMGRK